MRCSTRVHLNKKIKNVLSTKPQHISLCFHLDIHSWALSCTIFRCSCHFFHVSVILKLALTRLESFHCNWVYSFVEGHRKEKFIHIMKLQNIADFGQEMPRHITKDPVHTREMMIQQFQNDKSCAIQNGESKILLSIF